MKSYLILIIALIPMLGFAQTGSLSGQIVDESSKPLTGALIYLEYPWKEVAKSVISDIEGFFKLEEVEYGGYLIRISYLGYRDVGREINLDQSAIDFGMIQLSETAIELTEVEVKDMLPIATQQGDTTAYNANAFKTLPDASAEDLIRKMPGIVLQDGKVQAQGEDVKQVLVDGQPFFGEDPNAALKNLPAEVIQKIEVYDQQSEQAKFTGFDDGNAIKTINIVTKTNMRNGQFGKIYSGLGGNSNVEEDWKTRYEAGGNASIFNGKQRISIIGQSNNVNQQNFSTSDILGVTGSSGRRRGGRSHGGRRGGTENFLIPGGDGVATTHAVGINYSDTWGEKVKISGSYFFNTNERSTGETIQQDYISDDLLGRLYKEENNGGYENTNHRFNLRLEAEIDSFTSLVFRPRMSWQQNNGSETSTSETSQFGESISESLNNVFSDLTAKNWNGDLMLRRRFQKRGRTISLNLSSFYGSTDGYEENFSEYFENTIDIESIANRSFIDNPETNFSGNLNYTEPLGKSLSLMLQYRPGISIEKVDESTYDLDEMGENLALSADLSNQLENRIIDHTAGLGLNFRQGRDLFAMARVSVKLSQQELSQQLPSIFDLKRNYLFLTPFAMLRWKVSKQENVRLFYRGNTSAPQAAQLIEALDQSNPLQLSIGNSQLRPSQNHRIFGRWQKTNTEKATLFYVNLGATFSPDAIENAVYTAESSDPFFENIRLRNGAQLIRPVNLDGSWSVFSFITYGLPLKKIKCNLNFNLNSTLANTPGLIDNIRNDAQTLNSSFGITFSSNFSEKLDFNIGSSTGWQSVSNSLNADLNAQYLDQRTFGKLDWILPADFIIRTNISHRFYKGNQPEFKDSFVLFTAGIGKKLFKDKKGELLFSVFDLFEQNQSIKRNITPLYIEDINSQVLQRYFMLSFTYNFRNFNLGDDPTGIEEQQPHWKRF